MEDCKYIPLSKGQVAIVDAADYEWLMQWKWFANSHHTGDFYAARNLKRIKGVKRQAIKMHRAILGLESGDPRQGDHKNGNKLDNRRSNLRVASVSQNQINRIKQRNNTTGFKGVCPTTSRGSRRVRYESRISVDGRTIQLGTFATPEEAHVARCAVINKYHGDFARIA